MMTAQQLRKDFPEFTNSSVYPDTTLTFWLGVAYNLLNVRRWGPTSPTASPPTLLDQGAELFAAHHAVLQAMNVEEAAAGNVPGVSKGMVTGQSVGDVSEAYDASSAKEENAGHWNLTTYGLQYRQLVRMVGAGGLQV